MPSEIEAQLAEGRERFLRYIRSKVSDPDLAEDILQDALLKALRSSATLRQDEKLIPWFRSVLNNLIIDVYRARATQVKRTESIEGLEFAADDPEDERALCECFRPLVPTLKPEYAELVRAELDGEDPDATVQRLGITPTNLKVRRHRARQALRQRLQETCRICAEHGCLDCTCNAGPAHR